MTRPLRPLRALVVDDSDASRAAIERILAGAPQLEVVATAADGESGLRQALRHQPDVVLLDLQMPRMDGFTFLRLLMAQRPTPVIVLSSQARRTDVFKALELGALDFVAKPEGGELAGVREELLEKCAVVRALRIENLAPHPAADPERGRPVAVAEAPRLVAIGASTGGPQGIQELLAKLPGELPVAIVIAQHMPEKFTGTFAERLARVTSFAAQEAGDGDLVAAGRVLVAPGGRHLELKRDGGGALRVAVLPRAPTDGARYCPSIDRLFTSAARLLGPRLCAVVLTGMGQDGAAGVVEVKRAGGLTLAESAETAVVYGMPQQAVASGAVDEVHRLGALAGRIERFARGT